MRRPTGASRIRVLLVEDDEDDAVLTRDLLATPGGGEFDVQWAREAEEGLRRLKAGGFDVCLLDFHLGGETGVELLARARAAGVEIPIIMLTGLGGDETDTVAMRAGAADYLEKREITGPLLIRVIRHALERAANERALRASEERFRRLVEYSADVMSLNAADGTLLYASPAITRVAGYELDEYVGRNAFEFVHPDDVDAITAAFTEVLAQPGVPIRGEMRMRHKDGHWLAIEAVGVNRLEDPGVNAIVVTMRDLSTRKATEERLHRTETLLEGASRLAELGSWEIEIPNPEDLAQGTIWWSEATARIFGYDPATVRPTLALFRELVHPDDRQRVIDEARTSIAEGRPFLIEHRIVRPDAEQRVVREQGLVDRSPGGVRRLVGTILDVTAQRTLEEQFRQSQKLEAVGRLAGGLAHDFNNVLTAITTTAGLLLRSPSLDAELRADVEGIVAAAERAARLTYQLLAYSRRQVLAAHPLDLNQVLTGIADMLRRLVPESIAIETSFAPDLGTVRADPGQIEQIAANLIVNARDAMREGGVIRVSTENVTVDEAASAANYPMAPGAYVVFTVRDTGDGMPADVASRIFEPFFTTKPRGQGTGLGLATVYGIVKQSGGYIFVETAPGRGTAMRIYLPRIADPPVAAVAASGRLEERRGTETVLVVEDEPGIRILVRRVLTRLGYTVLEASDPERALAVIERHAAPIDLVISDLVMPGGSGMDLAREICDRRPEVRVVLMSGYSEEVLQHRAVNPEYVFLPKPFTIPTLATTVRETLDRPVVQPRRPA